MREITSRSMKRSTPPQKVNVARARSHQVTSTWFTNMRRLARTTMVGTLSTVVQYARATAPSGITRKMRFSARSQTGSPAPQTKRKALLKGCHSAMVSIQNCASGLIWISFPIRGPDTCLSAALGALLTPANRKARRWPPRGAGGRNLRSSLGLPAGEWRVFFAGEVLQSPPAWQRGWGGLKFPWTLKAIRPGWCFEHEPLRLR